MDEQPPQKEPQVESQAPQDSTPPMQQRSFTPWLILGGILLVVVFYIGSNFFYPKNEQPVPTPTPQAKTIPQIIPDWQSFSNIDFGVGFQHPPNSNLFVGTDQITNDPQVLVDLKEKCDDETSALFSVTKSTKPPVENILNQMSQKIVVDNIAGISSPPGQTQWVLVTMTDRFYLMRFTTCKTELTNQILSTFDLL